MKKLGLLALIGIILSVSGHAVEKLNPFTDCGVGGMFFPDKEDRFMALIVNLLTSPGSSFTSWTLTPNACGGKKTEAAALIYHTYPNIVEETANGDGRHVNAMLTLLECDSSAKLQIRDAFSAEMSQPGYLES